MSPLIQAGIWNTEGKCFLRSRNKTAKITAVFGWIYTTSRRGLVGSVLAYQT